VLMVGFAFAMVWIGVLIGSVVPTPEGVMGIGFATMFPLTFVASTFVPLATMPEPLQTFAAWNPITTLADALRKGFGNPNTPIGPADPWSIAKPTLDPWVSVAGLVVVCGPLAARMYARSLED